MESLVKNIKNKILNYSEYKYMLELDDILLSDNVILFNILDEWKIIPLNICLSYPIIYDEYEDENEKFDISIIVCPLTLKVSIFKGKFIFDVYQDSKMYIREFDRKESENMMALENGYIIDDKYYIKKNKRIEVKILTLKNALLISPDVKYLKTDKKIKYIIDEEYYNNYNDIDNKKIKSYLIHPKTLVYVLRYKNEKKQKINIIVGKNANNENITGYDINESGLIKYLADEQYKIINKKGYMTPILWMYVEKEYENPNIIYII